MANLAKFVVSVSVCNGVWFGYSAEMQRQKERTAKVPCKKAGTSITQDMKKGTLRRTVRNDYDQ